KNNFRLVIAINKKLDNSKKIYKSLDVVKTVITFDEELQRKGFKKNNQSKDEFKSSVLKYLLKYCFGLTKEYILDRHTTSMFTESPIFIGRGSVNVSTEIGIYINKVKDGLDADQLHELEMTRSKVSS